MGYKTDHTGPNNQLGGFHHGLLSPAYHSPGMKKPPIPAARKHSDNHPTKPATLRNLDRRGDKLEAILTVCNILIFIIAPTISHKPVQLAHKNLVIGHREVRPRFGIRKFSLINDRQLFRVGVK